MNKYIFLSLLCVMALLPAGGSAQTSKDNKAADTLLFTPPQDTTRGAHNAEVDAAFPGGVQGWYRYLNKHLRYPKKAKRERREGVVEVKFVIDRDGKITDVNQISGDPVLGEELVRVISASPKWVPATQGGIPVRAFRNQPITFHAPVK